MLRAIFSGMRNLTRNCAMKRKRLSEEQLAFVLRQAGSGTTIEEICRKREIPESTFNHWKRVYRGMGVTEIREREAEHAVADLDKAIRHRHAARFCSLS
jgi:putative transposase